MKDYLFIHKDEEKIEYGKVVDSKLNSYFVKKISDFEIGDIYRVRVVKKVVALHCFFVELKNGKNGFLDFKDTIGEIKVGDVIFVEIYKINAGDKAPNVSMNFSISSLFSVVSFKNSEEILISKKLKDFKFDIDKIKALKSNFSIKLRTKSVYCDEEFLLNDISENLKKMQEIVDSINNLPVPKLIYKKENFLEDFLIENEKYSCILNEKELYKKFKNDEFLKNELIFDEEYSPKYDYNIGIYLENLNKKVVEVENINIVIEKTEALTVIDVNSKGKTSESDKSKNALSVNLIAIDEILRQISFRDISGIIIVDFINMKAKEKEVLEEKISKIQVLDNKIWNFHGFTKLGLYEITRQRGK